MTTRHSRFLSSRFTTSVKTPEGHVSDSRAFFPHVLPAEQPSLLVLLADLGADLGDQPGTETHNESQKATRKCRSPEKKYAAASETGR